MLRFTGSYAIESEVEQTSGGALYYVHDRDWPQGVASAAGTGFSNGPAIDASRVVPTGAENVPQHVHLPAVLYLGRMTQI